MSDLMSDGERDAAADALGRAQAAEMSAMMQRHAAQWASVANGRPPTDELRGEHTGPDGTPVDWSRVRGDLFKESGKFGYRVMLDYSGLHWQYTPGDRTGPYMEPADAAEVALAAATAAGTSEVRIGQIPEGWHLVVLRPPNGWPVLAHGGAW